MNLSTKNRIVGGVTLFSAFSLALTAQGQKSTGPIFPTTKAITQIIAIEDEYVFRQMQYEPAVKVVPVTRESARYDSPEATTIAAISAMRSKDYNWYKNTWDNASQTLMEERDRKLKRPTTFWTDAWDRAFRESEVQLTTRIETGEYVLIVYKLTKAGSSQPTPKVDDVELVTVLKAQDGKWLVTQELSQDPVLLYWKTPEIKTKRLVRGSPTE